MTDLEKAFEKFDALARGETPPDSPDFDAAKVEPPVEQPVSAEDQTADLDLLDFAQDVGQRVDELNATDAAGDAIERAKR